MKLFSKLLGMQHYLRETGVYLGYLQDWTRNHVFQVTNVPIAPPPPNPTGIMELDHINISALVNDGGERELYDYIKAVMNNEVFPANRASVSDPTQWESEHYKFVDKYTPLQLLSVLVVDTSDLPNFHHCHREKSPEGIRYVVGPDGTWYNPPEKAIEGWSVEKDGLVLKLRLSYAKSDIPGELLSVSITPGGTCSSTVRETLTIGQPEFIVNSIKPFTCVTQEEFEAAFELYLPGSLIDHQERLAKRVTKVFNALIPVDDRFPPLTHLYGAFRLSDRRRSDGVHLGTKPESAFIAPDTDYTDEQVTKALKSTGAPLYIKTRDFFCIGITENGRDLFFKTVWPGMTIVERLEFYVTLLSVYQHNHTDNYSAGGIFHSLNEVLA